MKIEYLIKTHKEEKINSSIQDLNLIPLQKCYFTL